ncbi:putative glutamic acid/alanine-rich protein [Trypanosoma theileri]|uniref:Putative glutamic acid/alanine-rich protein n=1 Tax=Trypanosoma theileri TaxID=67003 RepID=A0A1X0NNB3_9TRYP|nr:putative glutamic acid/alanine-rich protein [Trypanosoma theileri]ORC86212.1 putative glutamic acid/alanine-rich protein [Trypanosoma theileri]
MPPKGRKRKNAAPLLVAPEPQGDELEADMLWDKVKEVNDKPQFMDGTLVDATRAAFERPKGQDGTAETARNAFRGKTRHLNTIRASDMFIKSEHELKDKLETSRVLQDDAKNFESLKLSEDAAFQREKAHVTATALELMTELSDSRLTVLEDMEDMAESFFREQDEILERVCALAARGMEVEAAFTEQLKMREECRNAEESYFREHGEHVLLMAKMREETKRQQNDMLQSMIRRLETGVDEMAKLSVEELEDKAAQQEETSHLILELLKLQGQSVVLEKKTTAIVDVRTGLQRMIALEEQRHKLCIERQNNLRNELKSLSEEVKVNNLRLLEMASNNTSGGAQSGVLPTVSTSPNTTTNSPPSEGETGLAIRTLEARREVELANIELAACKNELWALRRHHLVQLSGQYQNVNLDNPPIRTTQDFFLDAETSAAVRSVILESLVEVSQCLSTSGNTEGRGVNLEPLLAVTDPEDRKAIQDYVVKRINKLFSCVCPTAPPLLFLQEAAHVQSGM